MFAAGMTLLMLGAIGIFLPVLPTTPFVIAATLCFSYSSEKMHRYVLKSKYFGEYVRNYREKKGVCKKIKIRSIATLWILMLTTIFLIDMVWVKLLLAGIGIAVTIHILSIKTRLE